MRITNGKKVVSAVVFAAGLSLMSSAALADECSDSIDMVTQAADAAGLSQADMDVVNAAKGEAAEKQASGDTEGCLASLASVKQMLNL